MHGRLVGKVALVSAAARGIGAAITRRFADEGARVVASDVDAPELARLVDELRTAGADVVGLAGDGSDPAFVRSWVTAALEAHGRIDVLSNNIGVSRPGLVADISAATRANSSADTGSRQPFGQRR